MTRAQLMADFEKAFAAQFESGNFSLGKDTIPTLTYTDNLTYWAFMAWVSAYETYRDPTYGN